ncbi:hypothetical protein B5F33_09140 [Collinsella sp. An2]|nr:hypothetical protein B5F33_09140 [Collinsella sp. An2]
MRFEARSAMEVLSGWRGGPAGIGPGDRLAPELAGRPFAREVRHALVLRGRAMSLQPKAMHVSSIVPASKLGSFVLVITTHAGNTDMKAR